MFSFAAKAMGVGDLYSKYEELRTVYPPFANILPNLTNTTMWKTIFNNKDSFYVLLNHILIWNCQNRPNTDFDQFNIFGEIVDKLKKINKNYYINNYKNVLIKLSEIEELSYPNISANINSADNLCQMLQESAPTPDVREESPPLERTPPTPVHIQRAEYAPTARPESSIHKYFMNSEKSMYNSRLSSTLNNIITLFDDIIVDLQNRFEKPLKCGILNVMNGRYGKPKACSSEDDIEKLDECKNQIRDLLKAAIITRNLIYETPSKIRNQQFEFLKLFFPSMSIDEIPSNTEIYDNDSYYTNVTKFLISLTLFLEELVKTESCREFTRLENFITNSGKRREGQLQKLDTYIREYRRLLINKNLLNTKNGGKRSFTRKTKRNYRKTRKTQRFRKLNK